MPLQIAYDHRLIARGEQVADVAAIELIQLAVASRIAAVIAPGGDADQQQQTADGGKHIAKEKHIVPHVPRIFAGVRDAFTIAVRLGGEQVCFSRFFSGEFDLMNQEMLVAKLLARRLLFSRKNDA